MSFVKRDVKDRAVEHPRRYQLVEVEPGVYDLIPVTGTVTEPGTAINKAYLQPIEDGLEVALEKTGDGKDVIVTFTEASAEAHIASGEKLSIMFGKILKKFKSIVPISLGGTGGSTVAAARNNLGLGNTAGALPVANGGTGSTTAANARTALGVPPINHASTGTDYGVGNASNYGHVKVINNLTDTSTSGAALSPAQGKALKDLIDNRNPEYIFVSGTSSGAEGSPVDVVNFDATKRYRTLILGLGGHMDLYSIDGNSGVLVGVKFDDDGNAHYFRMVLTSTNQLISYTRSSYMVYEAYARKVGNTIYIALVGDSSSSPYAVNIM